VNDRKSSGRPTVLNDVSVENIQHSLVTSPRKFSIYIEKFFKLKFKKSVLRKFSITLYFHQLVHKLWAKEFLVSSDLQ
jgi:hypothetical protein